MALDNDVMQNFLSDITPQPIDSLLQQMQGASVTQGWDIVCSYSLSEINNNLAASYQKSTLVTPIVLNTTTAVAGITLKLEYHLQLGVPEIQIQPGGEVQLSMALADGSYYIETLGQNPSTTTVIPPNTYTVQTLIPLAAVSGATGTTTPAGQVISFADGSDPHMITLDFKSAGYKFAINPAPTSSELQFTLTDVLTDYFQNQVSAIELSLSGLSNEVAPAGDLALTPQAFTFAITGQGNNAALSLFIQTTRMDSNPGAPPSSFLINNQPVLPIPAGYTASLILSNELITQGVLAPQFTNAGFAASFLPSDSSNAVTANLTSVAGQDIILPPNSGSGGFSNYNFSGIEATFSAETPLAFTISTAAMCSIAWNCTLSTSWNEASGGYGHTTPQYGNVNITLSFAKSAPCGAISDTQATLASLSVSPSDIARSSSAGSCSTWASLNGCSTAFPGYYDQVALQALSITLNLPNLYFFADTNLLSPGQRVIAFDTSVGMNTPCDFLLVGNVVTSTTTATRGANHECS